MNRGRCSKSTATADYVGSSQRLSGRLCTAFTGFALQFVSTTASEDASREV